MSRQSNRDTSVGKADIDSGRSESSLPHDGDNAGHQSGEFEAHIHRVLGEALALMLVSPLHEHLFLSDLKWRVLPALALGQYRMYRNKSGVLVGYVAWGLVSNEVEEFLLSEQPMKLRPGDWNSGKRVVVLDIIALAGAAADEMLKKLKSEIFDGGEVTVLDWDESAGKKVLRSV